MEEVEPGHETNCRDGYKVLGTEFLSNTNK